MTLDTLGFRGYRRQGVEFVLPPLCPVPAGVFTMGSDKTHDKDAFDDETPQYPVEVAGFAFGQHPVTVAEYACAVRANAVREPPTYTYPRAATWVAPEWRGKTLDWAAQRTRANHPVVMVAWTDVTAYAAWLAHASDQPWRLPTEAQWEKAARWHATGPADQTGRIYPWGDAFDQARCNVAESGIGTTTPVGAYPSGASPCGAQEMAGNLFEWTSSVYQPYPYHDGDGRERVDSTEHRVLRGGSWLTDSRLARAAYRYHLGRDNVSGSIGCRLCWLPAGA
jgi:formylglycine-generating enzyme required for sulfatase activity